MFNPISLIKEDLAKNFGNCYEKLWTELFDETNWVNSAHLLQLGMSCDATHIAKYGSLHRWNEYATKSFKQRINLKILKMYIFCTCCNRTYDHIENLCDTYLNETEFLGYEYYYEKTIPLHPKMKQELNGFTGHYNRLNIKPHGRLTK